jgi:outer membrane protein TolC
MSVGAGAVMAAYQAQGNGRRELLVASHQKRLELAQQRMAIAQEQLHEVERRAAVGMAAAVDKGEAQKKVNEAEAQVATIQLDLEEIRITGREPLNDLSSPRVSGRDFVSDRLRIGLQTLELASEREDIRRIDLQKRVDIGTADSIEVTAAQGRLLELKAARDNLGRKLDLRQRFLKGDIDAVETELRAQESEAEQRRRMTEAQIDLARKEFERMTKRVEVGTAPTIDLAKARLRLQELETDRAKAELDLALVRRQLDQRKAK